LLVLSGIIIFLLLIFLLLPLIFRQGENSESEWLKEMSKLDLLVKESNSSASDSLLNEEDVLPERKLFEFDPNLASEKDFKALGLATWQIKIIEKFRKRGGVFRKAEDFGKIYGIGKVQFETLEPYIQIQSGKSSLLIDTSRLQASYKSSKYSGKNRIVEINSCDSTMLDKFHGIGSSLAARIIKYRDRLGGFSRLDQLLEVYGLKSEIYLGFLSDLKIDTSLIKSLKINSIQYKELRKHPYLNPYQARAIIKYRELKGRLNGVNDIEKNNLLPAEVLIKIKPYLSFE